MPQSSGEDIRRYMPLYLEEMHSVERLYEQYAKSVGLTRMALSILRIIRDTPAGCTQKLIGEKARLPKQSVNAVIRGLWKQGHIIMSEMDSDRRNKEIFLSDSGRRYADEVLKNLCLAEEYALERLTEAQREQLIALMRLFGSGFRERLYPGAEN